MSEIDHIRRAERAQTIMGDDLVREAFDLIEKEFVALWLETGEKDNDGRERIYRLLWSARHFKAIFAQVIDEGKIHRHQLEQLKRGNV